MPKTYSMIHITTSPYYNSYNREIIENKALTQFQTMNEQQECDMIPKNMNSIYLYILVHCQF